MSTIHNAETKNVDRHFGRLAEEIAERLAVPDDIRVSDTSEYSLGFEQKITIGKGRRAYDKWESVGCVTITCEYSDNGAGGKVTVEDALESARSDRYQRVHKGLRAALVPAVAAAFAALEAES